MDNVTAVVYMHRGSMLAKNLSWPNNISLMKDDQPVQPRKIKFPSHMIGRQYRSFSPSLYDKYLWLEYSECEDAVYCFYCRHLLQDKLFMKCWKILLTMTLMPIMLVMRMDLSYRWIAVLCDIF